MNKLFVSFISILLCSCGSQSGSKMSSADSLIREIRVRDKVDSIMNASTMNAFFDTIGVSTGPVKVIDAHLNRREYSSHKDISLTFQNVSDKKIDAIRFRWYGVNAFGEPADMGNPLQEGFGAGVIDDPIGPGKKRTSIFEIMSAHGKKIVKAWAFEVMYEDGTKWKSTYQGE